jgi:hypothetical protein
MTEPPRGGEEEELTNLILNLVCPHFAVESLCIFIEG